MVSASTPEKTRDAQYENRYRLLVEAVECIENYAIFMLDPQGYILTSNAGAQRIQGYTEQEIVGEHFSIFYTEADLKRRHPDEELQIAQTEGRFEEEGWRLKKDGSPFWASVLITRLTDAEGHLLGFSKVTRDLSERRKAEDALRISEERFRQLVEGVKDYAIFLLDSEGRVATWNDGAERLKGYTREEVIGKSFSIFYPSEDIEAGKCEYELAEASLTGRYQEEGWRLRKDGTRFWANVLITALRNSQGHVTGFSKITRDLTERKRAEEQLRRANESLERRVQKRTQELTQTKERLELAVKARDEFLSIASHELKTPLTSLKLHAQMVQAGLEPGTSRPVGVDRLAKSVAAIVRQTERLGTLIDDLLDVSRAHLGKLSFNYREVSLSDLVQDVLEQWLEPLRAAGCVMSRDIQPKVVGHFDAYRIEQVIANLLSNVIKYAPGMPVHIGLKIEKQNAVLSVRDGGPGIVSDKSGSIFERYERAQAAPGVVGLGLGLFIARTIVEAHHGQIGVENHAEGGAEFVVRIPLNIEPVRKKKNR